MERPLVYLPSLHRTLAPAEVPGFVVFIPPGLPQHDAPTASSGDDPAAAVLGKAINKAFPLTEKEASATLGELLGAGEAYAGGGFLRQLYANRSFMHGRSKWEGAPGEFADLNAFAAAGRVPDRTACRPDGGHAGRTEDDSLSARRRALVDCQKVLLLAWWREEKLLELAGLERRFLAAERALNAALADGEVPAPPASGAPASVDAGVPWRVMMDAALPFLPEDAALFTADETMTLDLYEAGLLRPLPAAEEARFAAWPPPALACGLMYAEEPAWRLVGRKETPAERPWLDRVRMIFAVRPGSGPVRGGGI